MAEKKRYKQGHFLGIGIAIGIPIGIPIGLAMGNIAFGPALGLPIGLAIGAGMERKLNPNPIPLSDREQRNIRRGLWIALAAGSAIAAGLVFFYLS